ncbi:MAG TPA: DEAD/DEAH box helicase [Nitrospinota bacterium]|nr:DEAD/DEAH box helicase [Nitrospinota bacterium]
MPANFDAIIIGTGQAGPSLADRLNREGLKTAVIERKEVGGACVNVGCTPTKALVASARAAHMARRGPDFGVVLDGPVRVDMKKVKARMKGIAGESNRGLTGWLEGMENVTLYRGHGRFEGPNTVQVDGEILQADKVFLNVGARASVPNMPGLDAVDFLVNSTVLEADFLPEHLIITGIILSTKVKGAELDIREIEGHIQRNNSRDRATCFRAIGSTLSRDNSENPRLIQVRVEETKRHDASVRPSARAPAWPTGDFHFMTHSSFTELGVAAPLRRALKTENYINPTPIQARTIPLLLAGKDLIGIAQTGTGKTAAFALPILQRLSERRQRAVPCEPRALILSPTRELALQIGDSFKTYGRHLGLRQAVIMGGVGQQSQVRALARGVDILIATPGRLLDLIGQGHVRLDEASFLVLDEADRMLDMGFIPDVRKIMAVLPKQRQSMLFSATMPPDVVRLAREILREPVRVEVSPEAVTVERIDQRVFFVEKNNKRALLAKLLLDPAMARVLVFTRTKRGANRVAEQLSRAGVATEALHGNKSQNARQLALSKFRTGRSRVLVATDVASRGIDVEDVTHVINYEVPNLPESYVHRVGRTARAGAEGVALSFCDPTERAYLRDIERLTKRPIAVVENRPIDNGSGSPPRATPSTRPAPSSPRRRRRSRGAQASRAV